MDEDLFWRLLHADLTLKPVSEPLGAFRVQESGKTVQRFEDAWRTEREEIYDPSVYDRVLPRSVLSSVGKAVKGVNLLRDRRWEALL